jgi:DNA-binding beta-propeller fold protein YncE
VDPDGFVYVADPANQRVVKFNPLGAVDTTWPTGYFPAGVAVSPLGRVYVVNRDASQVEVFAAGGTFLFRWGAPGAGDGEFDWPYGIAVDALGDVYVCERDNSRVQKFDAGGAFLTKWGSPGTGEGQFNFPSGVAVDGSGQVFVADRANHRVEVFGNLATPVAPASWGRLKALFRN